MMISLASPVAQSNIRLDAKMNLEQQIEYFIIDYCQPASQVVVGLSGGVDSVVLLDLLCRSSLNLTQLSAVHVNHGLNKKANDWLSFCRELCAGYGVDFYVEHLELAADTNIEARARDARYKALAKYITEDRILVTAQHSDDQAETLLLALKRGAGSLGLAAMPPSQKFSTGWHNRPLLDVSRAEIEAYAIARELQWIEDDSNQDSRFDRNYLRNEILPQLNRRWQGFNNSVARSASLLGQANELLDELAIMDYRQARLVIRGGGDGLSIDVVTELSAARQGNLIRYWLRLHGLAMPSQAQLNQIVRQLLNGAVDSDPIILLTAADHTQHQIRRYQRSMMIVRPHCDISNQLISWQGQRELALPDHLGTLEFSLQKNALQASEIEQVETARYVSDQRCRICLIAPHQQEVEIRFYIAGSHKAWPIDRDRRRSVKKLWQEYAVPTWMRSRIPLVFFGNQLVAAVGVWVERGFDGTNNEQQLTITWRPTRV